MEQIKKLLLLMEAKNETKFSEISDSLKTLISDLQDEIILTQDELIRIKKSIKDDNLDELESAISDLSKKINSIDNIPVEKTPSEIVVKIDDNTLSRMKGEKGDKGDKGDPGEQGPQGSAGIQGEKGDRGDKGDPGDIGPAGEKGDQGEQGIQGIQGLPGTPGDKGDRGDQGENGDKGDPGQGIPTGGASGQILSKRTNDDYDTEWIAAPSAGQTYAYATTDTDGVVRRATVAEATDGTDTAKYVTPEGVKAAVTAAVASTPTAGPVLFVNTLSDLPPGTPVDTLVVVRAA